MNRYFIENRVTGEKDIVDMPKGKHYRDACEAKGWPFEDCYVRLMPDDDWFLGFFRLHDRLPLVGEIHPEMLPRGKSSGSLKDT